MNIFLRFCLLAVLTVISISAQEPEPLSFFPHHVGDTWAYQYKGSSVLNSTITDIQIDEQQNVLIYQNNNTEPAYKITSELDVYFSPTHNPHLDYKLSAHKGSTWQVKRYSNSSLMARVQEVYQTLVFAQPSTVMAINYYEVPDPDTAITDESPYRYTHFLASGFGFIRQLGESGDVPIDLIGCVIDGKTFGTVTDVGDTSLSPTFSITVSPNPCSSFTTITVPFSTQNGIYIALYNSLGTLIWQQRTQQSVYILNTTSLPTGIYFCRVTAGLRTAIHKIIIRH